MPGWQGESAVFVGAFHGLGENDAGSAGRATFQFLGGAGNERRGKQASEECLKLMEG